MQNKKVGVMGLGYVGFPLLSRLVSAGIETVGYDVDEKRIDELRQTPAGSKANITDDALYLSGCDYVIICVPTPVDAEGLPDLSFVRTAMVIIANAVKKGTTICLESTVNPGVTRSIVTSIFPATAPELKLGTDLHIVYSPEREDPTNREYNLGNTPKLVSGLTEACLAKGMALYRELVDVPVPVSSLEVAEAAKCLENAQRLVNISLMNEYKRYTALYDIDIFEVIDAAATKPFGFTKYYPSVGVGGHCIPVDPQYVLADAHSKKVSLPTLARAVETNTLEPHNVFKRIKVAQGNLDKVTILLVGVTYKPNISDTRESASMKLLHLLSQAGAYVTVCDPMLSDEQVRNLPASALPLHALDEPGVVSDFDVVVTTVKHDAINFENLYMQATSIIDTAGIYRKKHNSDKVRRA